MGLRLALGLGVRAFRVGRITQQTNQNAKMVPNEAKYAALPSTRQFATRKTASKAPAKRSAPGSRRARSPGLS